MNVASIIRPGHIVIDCCGEFGNHIKQALQNPIEIDPLIAKAQYTLAKRGAKFSFGFVYSSEAFLALQEEELELKRKLAPHASFIKYTGLPFDGTSVGVAREMLLYIRSGLNAIACAVERNDLAGFDSARKRVKNYENVLDGSYGTSLGEIVRSLPILRASLTAEDPVLAGITELLRLLDEKTDD